MVLAEVIHKRKKTVVESGDGLEQGFICSTNSCGTSHWVFKAEVILYCRMLYLLVY